MKKQISRDRLKRELALVIAGAVLEYGHTRRGEAHEIEVVELNRGKVRVQYVADDAAGYNEFEIKISEVDLDEEDED